MDPFFDTNILIDWLIGRPEASRELAHYRRHRISRIVWAEVLAGEAPAARDAVELVLRPFEIVELDARIARVAAEIRQRTRMKLLDAFILATAEVHDATLITRNTRDFPASMPAVRVPYTI